ncbi:uncharacterized protein [Diadema antillarum]|uniref:uncharacterized protein n=1 Tax=Diadema antillarum TaxID=105358 RepID=UPI003A883838
MADTEQQPTTEEQTATKEEAKAEEPAPAVVENGEAEKKEEAKEDEKKEEGGEEKKEEGGEANGKTEGEGEEKAEGAEKEDANGDAKPAEPATPEVCLDAPTENPLTDEDYQEMIKLDAAESEEGWEKIKKHKEAIVFRKAEKNGAPVIKASMDFAGIPADKVLEFFTDPEQRRKWNKKSPTFEILEERDDFKIVYTVFKMPTACDDRDVVQCCVVRSDEEPVRHTILYKSCNHPSKPPNKGHIRADVGVMGIVIKPKEGDDVATHVTWVGQVNLKGWMPKMMVNKVTVGYPVSLYDDIVTYWKKLTGQDKKEKKDAKSDEEEKKEEGGEEAAAEGEAAAAEGEKPAENGEAAEGEAAPAAEETKAADEKPAEEKPAEAEAEKKEEAASEEKPAGEGAAAEAAE